MEASGQIHDIIILIHQVELIAYIKITDVNYVHILCGSLYNFQVGLDYVR
jgi:hypothetical protein